MVQTKRFWMPDKVSNIGKRPNFRKGWGFHKRSLRTFTKTFSSYFMLDQFIKYFLLNSWDQQLETRIENDIFEKVMKDLNFFLKFSLFRKPLWTKQTFFWRNRKIFTWDKNCGCERDSQQRIYIKEFEVCILDKNKVSFLLVKIRERL